LAALLERNKTGQGQRVDTSLFQTGVMFMAYHLLYRQFAGVNPTPQGSRHTAFAPYGAYSAADGFLMIGISGDKAFGRLCAALDHAEWTEDPRFLSNQDRVQNTPVLDSLMNQALAGKTAAEWKRILDAADVAVDPVQTAEQVLADPQLAALGQLESVTLAGEAAVLLPNLPFGLSKSPPTIQGPPPRIGEHSESILREAGFTSDDIAELKRSRCIEHLEAN
jgi:crotonobetainyl-CoA:carnitine CoA-transferase CaiB-like acyl-CoA transferase